MKSPNHCAIRPKFTLIELLVVIAILAILMNLLMSSLTRVMDSAKNTQCVNGYKSKGAITLLYASDYDDTLFQLYPQHGVNDRYYFIGSDTTGKDLRSLLGPYANNNLSFWICPWVDSPAIDLKNANGTYIHNLFQPVSTFVFFNYSGVFYERVRQYGYGASGFPTKINQARPNLPMMQDGYSKGVIGDGVQYWGINHSKNFIKFGGVGNSHLSIFNRALEFDGLGATILFYDGSARYFIRDELVRVDWLPNYDGPGYSASMKSVLLRR